MHLWVTNYLLPSIEISNGLELRYFEPDEFKRKVFIGRLREKQKMLNLYLDWILTTESIYTSNPKENYKVLNNVELIHSVISQLGE